MTDCVYMLGEFARVHGPEIHNLLLGFSSCLLGTMSYGDSKAVFRRRCEEIGFTAEVVELIVNHGLDTMAKFAFSCNFSPGSSDESPLIQLSKEIFKRAPSTVEMSCVRRLFSESYASIAADIKNSVEATDDMPTRKLAPAERAERLRVQQRQLAGINISGP